MIEWVKFILSEDIPTWVKVVLNPIALLVFICLRVLSVLILKDWYRKYVRPLFNFPEPPTD